MASYLEAGGHRLAFHEAGPPDGPVVVLLHGLASDSATWDRALTPLAECGLRAIALDLVGHGESDKPATVTYLLDYFAASLRDFLDALGVERAVVCGHSFGGAVAVQFAATYRERVSHLVLVSAGGLGREVHLLLRAAALPLAPLALRVVTVRGLRRVYADPRLHSLLGLTADNVTNLRRAGRALDSPAGRAAFFASLRGVIEPGGQRGSFLDMGTLPRDLPVLLMASSTDTVIPAAHAMAAHDALPLSELVIFENARHEPHRSQAADFAKHVSCFVASH